MYEYLGYTFYVTEGGKCELQATCHSTYGGISGVLWLHPQQNFR